MTKASKRQRTARMHGLDGTGRAFGRNSLLPVALGLATCFSINDASAAPSCPGVSVDRYGLQNPLGVFQPNPLITFPAFNPSVLIAGACGANTGAIGSRDIGQDIGTAIDDVRKKKQKKLFVRRPLGFAPESEANRNFDAVFGALAYTDPKSPMYTKAPPPPESAVETALWSNGSYEHERQSGNSNGVDVGAVTRTFSGLGGVDWTWTLPSENYLTFGAFAGESRITQTMPLGDSSRTRAPTVGAYMIYYSGESFSAELSYAHSWFQNSGPSTVDARVNGVGLVETAQGTATAFDHLEGKLHYKFNPSEENGVWWWEPTAGFQYSHLTQILGISDQTILRLQGEVKIGATYDRGGGVKLEPSLTGLVYSDVSVSGGTAAGGPPVANDQGQVWGKGIAKLNIVWSTNFSTSVEGQIYGTSGTLDIVGYKAEVGLRYKW